MQTKPAPMEKIQLPRPRGSWEIQQLGLGGKTRMAINGMGSLFKHELMDVFLGSLSHKASVRRRPPTKVAGCGAQAQEGGLCKRKETAPIPEPVVDLILQYLQDPQVIFFSSSKCILLNLNSGELRQACCPVDKVSSVASKGDMVYVSTAKSISPEFEGLLESFQDDLKEPYTYTYGVLSLRLTTGKWGFEHLRQFYYRVRGERVSGPVAFAKDRLLHIAKGELYERVPSRHAYGKPRWEMEKLSIDLSGKSYQYGMTADDNDTMYIVDCDFVVLYDLDQHTSTRIRRPRRGTTGCRPLVWNNKLLIVNYDMSVDCLELQTNQWLGDIIPPIATYRNAVAELDACLFSGVLYVIQKGCLSYIDLRAFDFESAATGGVQCCRCTFLNAVGRQRCAMCSAALKFQMTFAMDKKGDDTDLEFPVHVSLGAVREALDKYTGICPTRQVITVRGMEVGVGGERATRFLDTLDAYDRERTLTEGSLRCRLTCKRTRPKEDEPREYLLESVLYDGEDDGWNEEDGDGGAWDEKGDGKREGCVDWGED
mmetsp:Transcript_18537/g.37466  ORF Transcript_18537/g.37466 Transcript_18537/m.37466 type:complete len:540 (-) Transcript_18537:368-1987(-)